MAERAIWAKNNTDDHKQNTAYKRKRYRRMHGPMHLIRLSGTIKLGNNYSRTTGKANEKAHQKIDQGTGSTANCCQCLFAYKTAYYHCICCIVKLLKKCAKQNRKKNNNS